MTLQGMSQSARDLYARIVEDELWGYRAYPGETAAVRELDDAGHIRHHDGRIYPAHHGLAQHIDQHDGSHQ